MSVKQKNSNCLWFDKQAEEAANFYISIFPNSNIDSVSYYTEEGYEHHRQKAGAGSDGCCF